jgi:G patch domain-containing protein 1
LIGGFGLGALNDADEDDLDVYDSMLHPSSSSRQRVAYDHAQGADDDETVFIGSRRAKADAGKNKGADVRPKFFFITLISFDPEKAMKPSSHFRDGRAVLQGFILSSHPVAQDEW